jgi:hypothetical protein
VFRPNLGHCNSFSSVGSSNIKIRTSLANHTCTVTKSEFWFYDDPAEENVSQRPVLCVSPKSGTGVISSKIKHFQCHSLPDRVYSTHKFTMFHRGWPSDVSNGHRSSTVCLLKKQLKSKYLPLKYCSGWNYDRVQKY